MATVEQKLRKAVREVRTQIFEEFKATRAPKIADMLEDLRKKFEDSGAMDIPESIGEQMIGSHVRMKRVDIKAVSEALDLPINELMLYLLNNVKVANEQRLVEYHLGYVHFFATDRYKIDK